MSNSRFPASKYLRQVRKMQDEIGWWRVGYLHAAAQSTTQLQAGRLEGRAAVLEDAFYQLSKLHDTLGDLPRLS